jgi:hypothetical protein
MYVIAEGIRIEKVTSIAVPWYVCHAMGGDIFRRPAVSRPLFMNVGRRSSSVKWMRVISISKDPIEKNSSAKAMMERLMVLAIICMQL